MEPSTRSFALFAALVLALVAWPAASASPPAPAGGAQPFAPLSVKCRELTFYRPRKVSAGLLSIRPMAEHQVELAGTFWHKGKKVAVLGAFLPTVSGTGDNLALLFEPSASSRSKLPTIDGNSITRVYLSYAGDVSGGSDRMGVFLEGEDGELLRTGDCTGLKAVEKLAQLLSRPNQ